VTISLGPGLLVPLPACRTIEARPDAVLAAVAGGLATFSGAGIGVTAGGFCWAATVVASTAAKAKAERYLVIR
jgi:NaMN:DMB phosphoribosyltransferase